MRVHSRVVPFAGLALALLFAAAGVAPAPGASATSDEVAAARGPETIRWPSAAGEVVFDHRMHAEDLGAECASCHHGIEAASLTLPHPGYFDDFWVNCKTCHTIDGTNPAGAVGAANAGPQVCASCHPKRTARPNVEMLTAKVAIHRSCWSCHAEGRGAEASAQCNVCHQRPERPDGAVPAAATAAPEAANRSEARTP